MRWRTARRLAPRPVRVAVSRLLAERDSRRIERELAALVSGGGPIAAGPWLGEVGFELLYWAPFLAWVRQRYALDPSRLVAISRGGTRGWYPAGVGYADVLDDVPAAVFRAQHDRRVDEIGEQKQVRVTAFERDLVDTVTARLGIRGAPLLHPSTMYRLMRLFWWGHADVAWVHRHASYRRLTAAAPEEVPALPAGYTAIKFYFNDCLPESPRTREQVRALVARLAADGPVVSLSSGIDLDDHGACALEGGVLHVTASSSPASNLRLQSAVVAGARRFVGTYGGFAYLAPFHGVPSVGYYANAGGFAESHLRMAHSALDRIGAGGLLRADSLTGDP